MTAEKNSLHNPKMLNPIKEYADFGNPLPTTVIAEMLGVAAGDRKMFRDWAKSWLKGTDSTDPEAVKRLLAEQKEAQEQLIAYLTEQLEWRRQHPQNDILTALIEAEIDGQRSRGIRSVAVKASSRGCLRRTAIRASSRIRNNSSSTAIRTRT